MSDVHLRFNVSDDSLEGLLALIRAQKANLILMGGDYAETADQCTRFFAAFKGVSAPLGVYAVPGNNDVDSMPSLRETMAAAGVTLLCNRHEAILLGDKALEIGGCDDHEYGSPCTRGLFSENTGYRILLSHYPIRPECSCELMLSGHTHAGQCNLLGITPYSLGFEHRWKLLGVRGLRRKNGMQVLIANGIGVSRVPLRLGAAPQIYLRRRRK